ncbi:MAG: phosphoenolpyruvate--protein phosphotransferase [Thermofilum sp.]
MLKFKGVVVSPGVASGPLLVLRRENALEAVERRSVEDAEQEVLRLSEAGSQLRRKLEEISSMLPREEREIVEAQILMLDSLVQEAQEKVRSELTCAEWAVKQVYEKYSSLLASGGELFALRAQDLRDLARRLVAVLSGCSTIQLSFRGRVLVAEEMDPIEFLEASEAGIAGLVTRSGGPTSHVSILARLRGVPYVIASSVDPALLKDGADAVLDAVNGYLIVEPPLEEKSRYEAVAAELRELAKAYSAEALLEPVTADGVRVWVACNAGSVEDLRAAASYGCGGVGLFRVEFAYMAKLEAPSEDELYELFRRGLELLGGGPLTVRAPDIGGDKPVRFLELPGEPNPQLGVRGARLLLAHRDRLLKPLIRAVLRAAVHGDIRLMFPMITSVEEVEELTSAVAEEAESLESLGAAYRLPKLGVMVEVPSAALLAREIVEKGGLSFISFGTNDLTQYVLAADRGNPRVSSIYDEMNPAVLRLVRYAAERVKGKAEVEVCGEMASRGLAVPVLLGLGVEVLSVAPAFVGRVKYVIRRVKMSEVSEQVRELVERAATSSEVRAWSRKYLESVGARVLE